jgi:catechol 2,3-dioxygenase-like lactoylglutathione lyase family enzyme
MPRAIDHLVIPARDLAAQAELYRRLGFQVGARNRHPWGTENHIVQFDGAFLELIGLGEGFESPAPVAGVFSFARFVAEFLKTREGMAMLVLRSSDAEADRREFVAKGLGDFQRFDFGRRAQRPDGSSVDVAFSLAFASCAALPQAGFFVCQQHFPENFWNREAQLHPNGASGISGVVITHERPGEVVEFLSGFVDAPARSVADGFLFASIECITPDAFSGRFGVDAPGPEAQGLAAMRVAVAEIDSTASLLEERGVTIRRRDEMLIVDARDAMGALIAFAAN